MDIVTYALCKKIASGAVAGIKKFEVNGLKLIMTTTSDQLLTMTFPSPAPKEVDINTNNYLVFTMEDGTVLTSQNPIPGIAISQEAGNALTKKADGLYVPQGNVEISSADGNIITSKTDGIYASVSSTDEETVENVMNIVKDNNESENIDFDDFWN